MHSYVYKKLCQLWWWDQLKDDVFDDYNHRTDMKTNGSAGYPILTGGQFKYKYKYKSAAYPILTGRFIIIKQKYQCHAMSHAMILILIDQYLTTDRLSTTNQYKCHAMSHTKILTLISRYLTKLQKYWYWYQYLHWY